MSEALVPAAAEPVVVADGEADVVLPALIVDAGPDAVQRFLGSPRVKQHLAAIRMLCDWLVVSQVLPANQASAVRGPKHVVTKGSTPVLAPAEARPAPCRSRPRRASLPLSPVVAVAGELAGMVARLLQPHERDRSTTPRCFDIFNSSPAN